MYQTHIPLQHVGAVSFAAAMFTPLERTVLEIARRERGKGLLPTTLIGQFLKRFSLKMFGQQGVRPLADPRLEALRSFVNSLHRCSRVRIDAASAVFRSAGFDPLQETWIRSNFTRCA